MTRSSSRFRYSRWDGTQVGFDLDADGVLEQINDDLLYHGDLNAALRRLLHSGFEDRNGERVQGIKDLMDKLRQERRDRLERYDLGGVYEDIAEQLRGVVDTERAALDDLQQEAAASGDPRRQEVTDEAVTDRRTQLDLLLPTSPAWCVSCRTTTSRAARQGAVRRAHPAASRAARSALVQPDGRGHERCVARGAGADQGHAGGAQPDAPGPQRRARARLRRLHGALRRPLPEHPATSTSSSR
ncbi:MAG: hypothetical protein R2701_10095 [Acidimicrobiales bacterium]